MAARLTISGAVVSHHTAGALHHFPVPDDARAHVTIVTRHDHPPGIVTHRLRLTDHDVEETRGGLLITTAQRTAIVSRPDSEAERRE